MPEKFKNSPSDKQPNTVQKRDATWEGMFQIGVEHEELNMRESVIIRWKASQAG